jgi:hypothetical protein
MRIIDKKEVSDIVERLIGNAKLDRERNFVFISVKEVKEALKPLIKRCSEQYKKRFELEEFYNMANRYLSKRGFSIIDASEIGLDGNCYIFWN